MTELFDFYGFTIQVSSTSDALVGEVRRHFAFFRSLGGEAQMHVDMQLSHPPYDQLPSLPASVFTPRNVCFQNGRTTYIDYFGEGLAIFDRNEKRCIIYGIDHDLVHEIAYLFVLSTVGRYLDSQKLHRVHALGVSYRNRGILLLLPSGGGKSTMALALMRQPGFLLLGEDTPLIAPNGRILPFPLRLGVRPEQKVDIPPQYLRTVARMEFDPKTLIDIEYFKDRLGQAVDPGLVLVGERDLGTSSEIVPLPRRKAFKAMVNHVIVGLGVYQGLEFLLERGLWELWGQGGVVASRLRNSIVLLRRAPAYRFVLGRDIDKNCQTFLDFVQQKYGSEQLEDSGGSRPTVIIRPN
jgi:hypothetical protein